MLLPVRATGIQQNPGVALPADVVGVGVTDGPEPQDRAPLLDLEVERVVRRGRRGIGDALQVVPDDRADVRHRGRGRADGPGDVRQVQPPELRPGELHRQSQRDQDEPVLKQPQSERPRPTAAT